MEDFKMEKNKTIEEEKIETMDVNKLFNVEEYKGQELKQGTIYISNDKAYQLIDSKVATGIFEIKGYKIPPKEKINEGVISVNIPQVPFRLINTVHSFFREIYILHQTEVGIILWYNDKNNEWSIEVPEQEVTGAHVDYKRNFEYAQDMMKKGYFEVGTIHSHAGMGAFHSGVDDNDEMTFDGLHMTMGNFNLPQQTFEQRLIVSGNITKLDFYQMVSMDRMLSKFYTIDTPEEWLNKVTKKIPTTNTSLLGYGSYKSKYNNKYDGFMETKKSEEVRQSIDEARIHRQIKKMGYTKQERRGYKSNVDFTSGKIICPLCLNPQEIGLKECILCETPLHITEDELQEVYNLRDEKPDYKKEETLEDIFDKEINDSYIY